MIDIEIFLREYLLTEHDMGEDEVNHDTAMQSINLDSLHRLDLSARLEGIGYNPQALDDFYKKMYNGYETVEKSKKFSVTTFGDLVGYLQQAQSSIDLYNPSKWPG